MVGCARRLTHLEHTRPEIWVRDRTCTKATSGVSNVLAPNKKLLHNAKCRETWGRGTFLLTLQVTFWQIGHPLATGHLLATGHFFGNRSPFGTGFPERQGWFYPPNFGTQRNIYRPLVLSCQ